MRYALLFALAVFVVGDAVAADERETLYGQWGTEKQCAQEPIKAGGTVLAQPFEIGSRWLKHGELWCLLTWYPVEKRGDGFFTAALAQCGEDSLRDYLLGMEYAAESLTMRWDFQLVGPLTRCGGS